MSELEGVARGNCARTAAELGQALEREGRDRRRRVDVRIVHGRPLATAPAAHAGTRFFHAWVEMRLPGAGWVVVDYSNGLEVRMPRSRYYRLGQLAEGDVVRYTVAGARRQMEATGTYGPWHPSLFEEVA